MTFKCKKQLFCEPNENKTVLDIIQEWDDKNKNGNVVSLKLSRIVGDDRIRDEVLLSPHLSGTNISAREMLEFLLRGTRYLSSIEWVTLHQAPDQFASDEPNVKPEKLEVEYPLNQGEATEATESHIDYTDILKKFSDNALSYVAKCYKAEEHHIHCANTMRELAEKTNNTENVFNAFGIIRNEQEKTFDRLQELIDTQKKEWGDHSKQEDSCEPLESRCVRANKEINAIYENVESLRDKDNECVRCHYSGCIYAECQICRFFTDTKDFQNGIGGCTCVPYSDLLNLWDPPQSALDELHKDWLEKLNNGEHVLVEFTHISGEKSILSYRFRDADTISCDYVRGLIDARGGITKLEFIVDAAAVALEARRKMIKHLRAQHNGPPMTCIDETLKKVEEQKLKDYDESSKAAWDNRKIEDSDGNP